ncbi:MAG TPA: toll/interleukin-1 receptor domain-containing protein [Candidatus Baltobacteraceae bacterium]|nr:toll/interleukin-1 receptor domain-containing protein [Candidatus Baltobacteraceae bacterium]
MRHVEYHFKAFGPPKPFVWRDKRNIQRSEQFDPIIADAVAKSDVFLAVLSNNWEHSDYCRKELEAFNERWKALGEHGVKSRIVVVLKSEIPDNDRPPLMRMQDGYRFYHPAEDELYEREFFENGKESPEFFALAKDLARDLWSRAKNGDAPPPPEKLTGRKVYLAKPAGDMVEAYARVANELSKNGYIVAPAADAEIPRDTGAREFVESQLQGADVSVHLLGDRAGYAPEDCDPIVKLQLTRAAAQAMTDRTFRRIVWAPRLLGETVRDDAPFGVLDRFDKHLPDDKIEGTEISAFCEFLIQHLDAMSHPDPSIGSGEGAASALKADGEAGTVYVYCDNIPEDKAYARKVRKALADIGVQDVVAPAFTGDPEERRALHKKTLRECAAVVLCWSKATDLWVKSNSRELKDVKALGRSDRFAIRSLVAGPPPDAELDELKEEFIDVPPRNEIDLVVDLRASDDPPTETLEPIAKAVQAWQPT